MDNQSKSGFLKIADGNEMFTIILPFALFISVLFTKSFVLIALVAILVFICFSFNGVNSLISCYFGLMGGIPNYTVSEARKALNSGVNHSYIHTCLAIGLYRQFSSLDKAMDHIDYALSKRPNNRGMKEVKAWLLVLTGSCEEGHKMLSSVHQGPTPSPSKLMMAFSLMTLRRYEEAKKMLITNLRIPTFFKFTKKEEYFFNAALNFCIKQSFSIPKYTRRHEYIKLQNQGTNRMESTFMVLGSLLLLSIGMAALMPNLVSTLYHEYLASGKPFGLSDPEGLSYARFTAGYFSVSLFVLASAGVIVFLFGSRWFGKISFSKRFMQQQLESSRDVSTFFRYRRIVNRILSVNSIIFMCALLYFVVKSGIRNEADLSVLVFFFEVMFPLLIAVQGILFVIFSHQESENGQSDAQFYRTMGGAMILDLLQFGIYGTFIFILIKGGAPVIGNGLIKLFFISGAYLDFEPQLLQEVYSLQISTIAVEIRSGLSLILKSLVPSIVLSLLILGLCLMAAIVNYLGMRRAISRIGISLIASTTTFFITRLTSSEPWDFDLTSTFNLAGFISFMLVFALLQFDPLKNYAPKPQPLSSVNGIGPKTEAALNEMGYSSVNMLCMSDPEMYRLYHSHGMIKSPISPDSFEDYVNKARILKSNRSKEEAD